MNFSENFIRVMAFILRWEGGYVNHPNDPGGETNFGISKRSHPNEDIKNMTVERAMEIYHDSYWRAIDGDSRPYSVALALMDFAVHSGTQRALQFWNESGHRLDYFIDARISFLASLSTFNAFGRGWIRRLMDLRKKIRAETEALDAELLVLYLRDEEFTFIPKRASLGKTNSGRDKIMVAL